MGLDCLVGVLVQFRGMSSCKSMFKEKDFRLKVTRCVLKPRPTGVDVRDALHEVELDM